VFRYNLTVSSKRFLLHWKCKLVSQGKCEKNVLFSWEFLHQINDFSKTPIALHGKVLPSSSICTLFYIQCEDTRQVSMVDIFNDINTKSLRVFCIVFDFFCYNWKFGKKCIDHLKTNPFFKTTRSMQHRLTLPFYDRNMNTATLSII